MPVTTLKTIYPIYYRGKGAPQNYMLAYVWLSLAAAQGKERAFHNRTVAEKKLTPQQLEKAQDLAGRIQQKIDKLNK